MKRAYTIEKYVQGSRRIQNTLGAISALLSLLVLGGCLGIYETMPAFETWNFISPMALALLVFESCFKTFHKSLEPQYQEPGPPTSSNWYVFARPVAVLSLFAVSVASYAQSDTALCCDRR